MGSLGIVFPAVNEQSTCRAYLGFFSGIGVTACPFDRAGSEETYNHRWFSF
jgi:hypothetical protein